MSGRKGYLIHNEGGGSLNWARFENVSFQTAEAAIDHVKRLKDSGQWAGRHFKVLEVPAERVAGFMEDIRKSAGATLGPLHVGEWIDRIPGSKFFGSKFQKAVAIGSAAFASVAASGSAYAATGDFNQAARAGYDAGKHDVSDALSLKRFGRGAHNILQGNVSAGLASMIEGVSDVSGIGTLSKRLSADGLERSRVEPAAERIFREKGAAALTREIIRTHEDPKYIILGNNTLPSEWNGKPMHEALKDDKVYRQYEHALQERISHSTGDRKEMWQGQLDTIKGFREALRVEDGVALPRPAPALGLNFQ